jgi:hypothetical protein
MYCDSDKERNHTPRKQQALLHITTLNKSPFPGLHNRDDVGGLERSHNPESYAGM